MKRLSLVLSVATALVVAAGAAWWHLGRPRAHPARPNVVLISIDSLRRDRLGAYGHRPQFAPERPVSPNLDALARAGVVFDGAWTTTSWTLPAHMALMTGLSNRSHGVEMDGFRLDPLRATLAESFQRAGYRTGGVFSGPYVDAQYGFGRGFDSYRSEVMPADRVQELVQARLQARKEHGLPAADAELVDRVEHQVAHLDVSSPRVNRSALEFLDEQDDSQPFFLFVHYFDVHHDYVPPPELARRFDPAYEGRMNGVDWFVRDDVYDRAKRQRTIGDRDLAHVMALYDAEIAWVDAHIGRIFDELKRKGLWDDTIVAVVSDHGEEFFEHGYITHRTTLRTELCSIPLLLRLPGDEARGRRVPELVRIYDVAPTLLDYAGVPGLPEAEGRSMRPLVEGRADEPRTALCRIVDLPAGGTPNLRGSWRDDRYTVTRWFLVDGEDPTGEFLVPRMAGDALTKQPCFFVFDRATDPGEHRPIPLTDPRAVAAIANCRRDFLEREEHARALSWSEPEARLAPRKSDVELAILRGLGYAGEGDEEEQARLLPVGPFPPPEIPR